MMMMKSVFWWRKPEYPEETTDLRQCSRAFPSIYLTYSTPHTHTVSTRHAPQFHDEICFSVYLIFCLALRNKIQRYELGLETAQNKITIEKEKVIFQNMNTILKQMYIL